MDVFRSLTCPRLDPPAATPVTFTPLRGDEGHLNSYLYRKRAKIHPSVTIDIDYVPDSRSECFEPEFDELHAFYCRMLSKAITIRRRCASSHRRPPRAIALG